jgi:hypothetical protein
MNWNEIKIAKRESRKYIWQHKTIFLASLYRVIATFGMMIALGALMNSLDFDAQHYEYAAKTTNYPEYIATISLALIGRMIGDQSLDKKIYQQAIIPIWHYLYRYIRTGLYVTVAFIGIAITVSLNAPDIIGYLWLILLITTYIGSRMSTLGITDNYLSTLDTRKAIQNTRPKNMHEWKEIILFHLHFLFHDLINIATFGLYGIWLIPYKRTTEQILYTKKRSL